MENYSFTRPVRGWIIFAQVIGTVFSIAGLVVVAAMYNEIMNSLSMTHDPLANTIYALIIAILAYVVVKQLTNMIVIINALRTMDDWTLSANRWIIASLSLTVGGFFTPLVMSRFPNVNIKSTLNPKVFLSKVYGFTFLIGGAIFIILFGALGDMNGNNLTATDTTKDITIAFFVISGFMTLLGAILTGLFARKNATEIYESNTSLSTAMKVFANVIAALVTLELVIMLIYNWVEVMGSIWEAFNSRNSNGSVNPFMIIIAIFNLFIGLIYLGYLTQVTCQTINGIWKGQATYTVFQPLANHENSNNTSVSL